MGAFEIQPLAGDRDRGWVSRFLCEHWGSARVASRGQVYQADRLPGFAALQEGEPVGLIIYRIDGDECGIVSLDSTIEGMGIGSALIRAVREVAASAGCHRLWLVTTNDNTAALRFYQKRGFVFVAVHRNALEASRQLKPEIPLVGIDGIPLRDEIELELVP